MIRLLIISALACTLTSCVSNSESVDDFSRTHSNGMLHASSQSIQSIKIFEDDLQLGIPSYQAIYLSPGSDRIDFYADIGLKSYLSCSAYQIKAHHQKIFTEIYNLWYFRLGELNQKPTLQAEIYQNKPIIYMTSQFMQTKKISVQFKSAFIHLPNHLLACSHNGTLGIHDFKGLMRRIAASAQVNSDQAPVSKSRIVKREGQVGFQTITQFNNKGASSKRRTSLILRNPSVSNFIVQSQVTELRPN